MIMSSRQSVSIGAITVCIDAFIWQGSKAGRFDLFDLTQIDLLTGHEWLDLEGHEKL